LSIARRYKINAKIKRKLFGNFFFICVLNDKIQLYSVKISVNMLTNRVT